MKSMDRSRVSLTLLFAGITFGILVISLAVAGALLSVLTYFEVLPITNDWIPDFLQIILFMGFVCMIVGTVISMLIVRIPLKPINWMITQMNRLADGDFHARLQFSKPLGHIPAFAEMEKSFNKMAQELENTEVLRSDFINNISHEFKTPLVSISGFAKLLQRGSLEEAQKTEYINAIVEESARLVSMATNVLALTKVENQSILTNLSVYNLSEQIRSAVLLLADKWERKNLELDMDFPEVSICANEDLLKEVWINLLHNAIKFSPEYGPLQIQIREDGTQIHVSIANSGTIAQEDLHRIWHKFYQGDKSHSSEGNGIGLAIVKRIVDLHRGHAAVVCSGGAVIFTISLPAALNAGK